MPSKISSRFRTKMSSSEMKQRWVNLSIMTAVYLLPLIVLFLIASSPLWYVREVLYPQTQDAREAYHSSWVRVPYILLCIFGTIASVLCLPMLGYVLYGGVRSLNGLRTEGAAMATAAKVFWTVIAVSAILICIMLPLFVTYRYNISNKRTNA